MNPSTLSCYTFLLSVVVFRTQCFVWLLCGAYMLLCRSSTFFKALSVFNVLHMLLGGLVGAAFHAFGLKYYVADGFARYSQYVDSVSISARHTNFEELMQHLVEGLLAQAVKIEFGWTLLASLLLAMLMLLWDIPMVRHQIKHIPTWSSVGMGVWRKYQRGRRLHHLHKMRRELV